MGTTNRYLPDAFRHDWLPKTIQKLGQKFNQRKALGLIPANAKIGGEIGIHGTVPYDDYAIDQYRNWTEGCISTKNKYVQELFEMLPVGTRVEIRR